MIGINIELTTNCPLHCPQCYCTLTGGKNIPLIIAKEKIDEALEHGIKIINLSGGETLCYPNLYELIQYISSKGIKSNVALSGWNFDEKVLNKLINAGVFGIFISLNGSTAEINGLSRNGFEYAINALKILQQSKYKRTAINWVMSSDNYNDFMNVVKIAEKYSISLIEVIVVKPDSNNKLNNFPNLYQMISVANCIKNYSGPVSIIVESCFPQMHTILNAIGYKNRLRINQDIGCGAVDTSYNISVDGKYTPCRHLDIPEDFDTIDEYLKKSQIVKKIKESKNNPKEPCHSCTFVNRCKPCLAMNKKLNGELHMGPNMCDLWKLK